MHRHPEPLRPRRGRLRASPTETADSPAFVALLGGDTSPDAGLALYRDRTQGNEPTTAVQRVNYDAALNGRLSVFGRGGNDAFYVDDNSAITTLDGGAGNDSFQIGQIFGLKRDTDEGALLPQDTFPVLVATTRGWLSPGTHAPLVATGGTGNDEFTVYSNQAELRLEGDDDNDRSSCARSRSPPCATRTPTATASAASATSRSTRIRPRACSRRTRRRRGLRRRRRGPASRRFRKDNNGDGRCNAADAQTTRGAANWRGRRDPARRARRSAAGHRARVLGRAAARHPHGRRRGRGPVQRERAGLGGRRHGLRQARDPRHRVRRRHRDHGEGHLRCRPQRALRERRDHRGRRPRGRRRVLHPVDCLRRGVPGDRRARLRHDQRHGRRGRGHRDPRARGDQRRRSTTA